MRGIFITFEGPEGGGKGTQIKLLADFLISKNHPVVVTKEPGGTPLGQKIRHLLVDKNNQISDWTELMLFLADRCQHIEEIIKPALRAQKIVISDRYLDGSTVYQGMVRGIGKEIVDGFNKFICGQIRPDLTIVLDCHPEVGLKRVYDSERQESKKGELDRIESEGIEFHKKVRASFLQLSKSEPRFAVIDTTNLSIKQTHQKILKIIFKRFVELKNPSRKRRVF